MKEIDLPVNLSSCLDDTAFLILVRWLVVPTQSKYTLTRVASKRQNE